MAFAVVAVAEFASETVLAIGSTLTAFTGVGAFAEAAFDISDALVSAGTALSFGSGIVSGLQAWALAAGAVGLALDKPKLTSAGSPQQFKADPQAPIPVVLGTYGVGGNIIYQTTSGGSNKHGAAGNEYLTSCVVLSGLGPIDSIVQTKMNQTVVTFDTGGRQGVNSGYVPQLYLPSRNNPYPTAVYSGSTLLGGNNTQFNGKMWMNTQLGVIGGPSFQPAAFDAAAPLTEWDSTKKLSGFAAAFLTCVFDTGAYAGGLPKPLWTLRGIKVYDPRQDSTYPGGSGSQRWSDRTTWAWNANPYIQALNFALGFYLPDPAHSGQTLLYAGIGAPAAQVDIAAFVAGANIADANGWTCNGQWSTADDKYSVMTLLLQAGGGQPADNGGLISCVVQTPQTAVTTLGQDDLADGPLSVDAAASSRVRINRVFPLYREPNVDYDWCNTYAPVTGSTYVTEDRGRIRSKSLQYEFVTNATQACQLAGYDIANSREGIVATLPCKLRWAQYPPGTCIYVNLPDAGLSTFKMRIENRRIDWKSGVVTLTLRSETDGKHTFALGQTGTGPATPSLTGADPSQVGAPIAAQWVVTQATVTDATSGESTNVMRVTGDATDNVFAAQVVIRYRVTGSGAAWTVMSVPSSSTQIDIKVTAGQYDVTVNYVTTMGAEDPTQVLSIGPITISASTSGVAASVAWTGVTGSAKPQDSATKSIVYRQTTAPTSPTLNDIWILTNTGGTALAVYAWNGSSWLLGGDPTGMNTAAAISGQSAWATYSGLTPTQLVNKPVNLLYNPTAKLGTQGWNQGGATIGSGLGSYGEGYYFYCNSGNQSTGAYQYQDIAVQAGVTLSLSALIFAGGISASTGFAQARVYIQWLNSSKGFISYSSVGGVNGGTGWTAVQVPNLVAPAGTYYARVFMDIYGSGNWTNTNAAWRQIKVEPNTVCTPYSDDTTYGATYQDGVLIDGLRPAQANADVTGSHTSAGFSGQGALATQNSLGYGSSYLTGFGSIAGLSSLSYGSGYLVGFGSLAGLAYVTTGSNQLYSTTYGYLTDGAIYTPIGSSAGFAGQGALATLNTADTGNINANAVTNTVDSSGDRANAHFNGGGAAYNSGNAAAPYYGSVTITTQGGPVLVQGFFNERGIAGTNPISSDAYLSRNGTNIQHSQAYMQQNWSYNQVFLFVDFVAAGTYTYETFNAVGPGVQFEAHTYGLSATELKR